MVDGNVIPVVDVGLIGFDNLKFLLGIVNKGAQLPLLGLTQGIAEKLINLTLDVSRSVLQHMLKSLILTMDISKKMLRSLWQIEYCLEVYNLGTGLGNCRE